MQATKTAEELMQDRKVLLYLDQLAAQIVADGFKVGDDIGAAAEAAQVKRAEFAAEMVSQVTRRSRIAKRALAVPVFAACNVAAYQAELRDKYAQVFSGI